MQKSMKSVLALALLSGVSISAIAADQGHGQVNFIGEIVNAPCSINPESVDQTVDLGQISNTALKAGGTSPNKTFTIQLEDCDFTGADGTGSTIGNGIELTFTGSTNAEKLLGVTGFGSDVNGQNVGIQINDAKNKQVMFGEAIDLTNTLQNGNNTLLFNSFLKGKAGTTVEQIPLGNFWGVTNFTIEYK